MPDTLARHMSYIAAPRDAWPWICDTFAWRLRELSCGPRDVGLQVGALKRILTTGAGTAYIAIPRGYGDVFVGWSLGMAGALIFAYVREECRREGIGAELIGSVVPAAPVVRVAYWTEDADSMAAHGVPLVYDIRAYQALLEFVRGPKHKRMRAVPVAA